MRRSIQVVDPARTQEDEPLELKCVFTPAISVPNYDRPSSDKLMSDEIILVTAQSARLI